MAVVRREGSWGLGEKGKGIKGRKADADYCKVIARGDCRWEEVEEAKGEMNGG